jgi:hypothetical protein
MRRTSSICEDNDGRSNYLFGKCKQLLVNYNFPECLSVEKFFGETSFLIPGRRWRRRVDLVNIDTK